MPAEEPVPEAEARRFERWASVVPALVLAAVAFVQIGLARAVGLTPWKGGGFGMFSTLDARPRRHVRVLAETPHGWESVGLGAAQRQAAIVETLPSATELDRLAQAVRADLEAHGRSVGALRIELWRAEHDPVTLRAVSRKTGEHVFRASR